VRGDTGTVLALTYTAGLHLCTNDISNSFHAQQQTYTSIPTMSSPSPIHDTHYETAYHLFIDDALEECIKEAMKNITQVPNIQICRCSD
jgi:hypothetical protein